MTTPLSPKMVEHVYQQVLSMQWQDLCPIVDSVTCCMYS